ncbi:hypothetical protein BST81_25410 [Leptolyngbya sp. 'hensonii']|uniref:sigma-70 region 4 domain-containing protein n=1 Tax=Leptolyngbya sp. 'hensonii' TaxID=1922337 RepID=UPI00094F6CB0|nr:sigma-70 region 4 domain-containing protein [Leptolyngbya sp. 'hensonii']OLP15614.1 hypothetical protein BST81_25410 [Leptolyngbya sp. 'hensonii']
MNDLLSTAEVADRLGVKPGTVRSWFHRYPELFQEGTHYVNDKGNKLWTGAGFNLFQVRATQDVTQGATGSVAPSVADPIDQQLQPVADAIALAAIEQRLPGLVQGSIHRILNNPTDLDSQKLASMLDRLGQSLGLLQMSKALANGLSIAVAASVKQLEGIPDGRQ